ncbi:WYL domain-containing protein [Fusobacterium mortiferum]|uniref:WYL domain-containing protein n=1 Tax=Fusobacterium mortiferum TaxID=850 RepID=A0A414Q0Q6_FUSMR|nr:WYL domain-containing protein [Fusobacterium mortiferum]RHF74347.1 WYL domain-containing protein [Fusobacterium mortiferum]
MEKKIRVTLNKCAIDIIEADCQSFKVTKNFLINYIFDKLKEERIENIYSEEDNKGIIQFNLNKNNRNIYYDILAEQKIQIEADFIRKMIYRYTHQSKSSRELFLYGDIVNRIKYGIKNKRVLKLTFDDERKTSILPFYIGSSKLELGNYIFCYDFLEMRYKNYKLSNIKTIFITQEEKEWENKDFIENVIKNFDPFLSQGKKIKVSLTEEGQKLLSTLALNRPETISQNGDIYEFRCSEEQAKRYFAYFLDDVKIIEPLSLKEWFIQKYKLALEKYGD